ncbi:multidrug effflux MFS transporter [Paracoccus sp. R12_1]|uniref:multidrug effflux MFS transporter n=1 Tax=unclassified Paracoccus (in: a-proteobacteria) TaxID=2688777 RepID=UPI000C0B1835|nr:MULTISPECIES: multidrug effflux MFS transporter [unclassified Paracoccus (in: a-proteobacteria)]MBO9454947.1 multidrug effflux MFS transporter [Paracoccus sp. R12_2]MBO9485365.1 multidrug effflux MFS transporter [Paracoccus sp. R12_1]PHQ69915.1 MAG: Bcr/CflA family drug resistance efflux transporter [Paracoccus sp. (in: a-proteobacteria)]
MTGARTPPHPMTLVALSGMGALSMNIFLPSLPGMARDFDVDYAIMQLSVSAYIGASAVIQLLAGPVSDRFGRRPVALVGLVIFALATVGTLIAPNATMFLLFRLIQAMVSVCLLLSRAAVRDIYDDARAASMIGYVTMGMAVVPMLAPVIGGVLDEAFGWRANFAMMGILGLMTLVLVWRDMGETVRGGGLPMRQQIANYPILARSHRFWGYCLAATLSSGCFFAYLGGAPFVGEQVFGLTPAQVGYFFAAPSVGYLAGNFMSGRFTAQVGLNRMILFGALICLVALGVSLLATLAGMISPLVFFGAIAFMGLGNGLVMPNTNIGMMSVRPELAGTASGLGGALAVAGGAVLSALAGALLQPGSGATPLQVIMFASAAGSLVSVLWVLRRERQLARVG